MKYHQAGKIGGKGAGPASFSQSLHALTTDKQDALYAAGDNSVKVFGAGGKLQRQWTTSGEALAVAVANDGSVYVGEAGQIEIFDRAGKLINTWRDSERLGLVTAIGFAGDSILAGDAKARCIRRYDRGGNFLNDIGHDSRRKGFLIPNGIVDFSVDREGIIHVTNPGKHRVERYTPEGELLGHIGRFDGRDPAGFSGCCNPTNVIVNGGGNIYVTEKAGPRAKVYDAAGNLLAVIAADAFDPVCKNMDIAVDSRGRVYVADTVKLEIIVFAPAPEGAS